MSDPATNPSPELVARTTRTALEVYSGEPAHLKTAKIVQCIMALYSKREQEQLLRCNPQLIADMLGAAGMVGRVHAH